MEPRTSNVTPITRNNNPICGDLGVNKNFEQYIYTHVGNDRKVWSKFKNNPNQLYRIKDILDYVLQSDTWLTPHDIPFTDCTTARRTLEYLHDEQRICKGPNDTYGNYKTYFKWLNTQKNSL